MGAQKAGHVQASLGGSPTRLDWIKAYLRLKEKDRGPLDFDAPGGADTTWQLIYLCLRSGFEAEAVEVRRTYVDAAVTHSHAAAMAQLSQLRALGQRDISSISRGSSQTLRRICALWWTSDAY